LYRATLFAGIPQFLPLLCSNFGGGEDDDDDDDEEGLLVIACCLLYSSPSPLGSKLMTKKAIDGDVGQWTATLGWLAGDGLAGDARQWKLAVVKFSRDK
jgi:hypothetical protein